VTVIAALSTSIYTRFEGGGEKSARVWRRVSNWGADESGLLRGWENVFLGWIKNHVDDLRRHSNLLASLTVEINGQSKKQIHGVMPGLYTQSWTFRVPLCTTLV
jgi:hypothetical protein